MSDVESLLLLSAYREPRQHLFPSQQSLEWYVKKYRPQLIAAGAILKVLRHWRVHPAKFDAFVLSEAQRVSNRSASCQ